MNHRFAFPVIAALTVACAGRPATTAAPPAPQPGLAAPAAPRAEPSALHYAPGTGRYRVETQTHVVQDVMGQVIEQDITADIVLSTTLAPEGGNLGMAITIDSLTLDSPGTSADDVRAARGRTLRLVLSPSGRVVSLTSADSSNPVILQLAAGLRDFLPVLPAAPIAVGHTWLDTLGATVPSAGVSVSTSASREHRVVGWEDRSGGRALRLTTTASYSVSGSGEVQGQALELAGSGRSTADHYVSADGVFLGTTQLDSALVNANVVSAGIVVPVRRTSRSSITRLP